ncbi:MAG: coenzyme F420-0:L-glutamate ligase [Candidatus Bathyarchaeota archaeon]
MDQVQVVGVQGIPLIKPGDDLGSVIWDALKAQRFPLFDKDILVVTQKVVSKAEGRIFILKEVKPSALSKKIAKTVHKQPELVELILRDAKSIIRVYKGHIITETRHGWICANSGVDVSNVSGGDSATLLPVDPDESAQRIRKRIEELSGKKVAVIISDTFGRPFRIGHTDVAIGSSGINPILDMRGTKDLFNYPLKVKKTAIIDELASAAELVIGNAFEKIPVAIIRGYQYSPSDSLGATHLVMPMAHNLFR